MTQYLKQELVKKKWQKPEQLIGYHVSRFIQLSATS